MKHPPLTIHQIRQAAAKCGIQFIKAYRQKRGIKLYAIRFHCTCCGARLNNSSRVQHRRITKLSKLLPNHIVSVFIPAGSPAKSILLTPAILRK